MDDQAVAFMQALLGTILLIAGITKLPTREPLAQFLLALGVPATLSTPMAVMVPFVEFGLAGALLSGWLAWYASVLAAALFAIFAVSTGWALVTGLRLGCHCFGALDSTNLTVMVPVRALTLGLVALVLTVELTVTHASAGVLIPSKLLPAVLGFGTAISLVASFAIIEQMTQFIGWSRRVRSANNIVGLRTRQAGAHRSGD